MAPALTCLVFQSHTAVKQPRNRTTLSIKPFRAAGAEGAPLAVASSEGGEKGFARVAEARPRFRVGWGEGGDRVGEKVGDKVLLADSPTTVPSPSGRSRGRRTRGRSSLPMILSLPSEVRIVISVSESAVMTP